MVESFLFLKYPNLKANNEAYEEKYSSVNNSNFVSLSMNDMVSFEI